MEAIYLQHKVVFFIQLKELSIVNLEERMNDAEFYIYKKIL